MNNNQKRERYQQTDHPVSDGRNDLEKTRTIVLIQWRQADTLPLPDV
ncbi:hypothetical protein ACGVWS_02780 [Enterobacteriaceae bacterium LUAb1]